MFGLKEYKNMFGEPGKGIHKYRLFNIAIIDVIATIILGYLFPNPFCSGQQCVDSV